MTSTSTKIVIAGVTVALTSAAFLVGRSFAGGVPSMNPLMYSGTLEEASGAKIDGKRNVEVKLWNTANETLCTTSSQSITFVNGHFSIPLPASCVDAVNKEPDTEVEVLVNGGSLGRAKLGAVPYALQAGHATSAKRAERAAAADRADNAGSAEGAAGALEQRIAAIESKAVSIVKRQSGWNWSCLPINDYTVDGGSNVLLRASLYQDSSCTVSANDPNQCHFFCAADAFTKRGSADGCCGVATYYTNGIVESLVIKPGLSE
jgi:hypothetical protein